jgi:SAM-dependent methyltransferase
MTEWYADERFWQAFYPFLFGEKRFDEARTQVEPLVGALELAGDESILDLCCGPGRFTVPLALRGFAVTGVDRSPFLLGKAREHAAGQNADVEWVQQDMREFSRPGAFDVVLNLFTSFGYFEDENEDLAVLRNMHASLVPGGKLLMDLSSKEWVGKVFQPVHAEEVEDGSILVERHRIEDGWERIVNEWILIRGESVERFHFTHRLYSGRELRDRLDTAGFTDVRLMGGLDGRPFDHEAERLVVLARRA